MTTRDRLTVAAAVAVLLASASLVPVYDGYGWVPRVAGAVLVVAGTSTVARALRVPRALQLPVALFGLAAYTAVVFASGSLAYGFVPTGATLDLLRVTVEQGLRDVEELAAPVPTSPGLVLLGVLGVGAIATLVDVLAVSLRKAAIAGLPLLLLFAVPSAVLPGGLGALPFVLTAAGWLGLLLADSSDTVSRWGTPVQGRRSTTAESTTADPGLGRVGRRIGVTALGIAVVVPIVVPGLETGLLGGGSGPGFGNGARSTTTYNPILELAGQLSLPEPRELLRYETDDPQPDYLRLTTLDLFDEDTGWSSSELSGDLRRDAVQDGIPEPGGLTSANRRPVSAQIRVTGAFDGPWLPLPFPPAQVDIDGPWLWDTEAETVFSTRTSLGDVGDPYVVSASRLEPLVTLLRGEQDVPSDIADVYGTAPELSPVVQQLLDDTIAGAATDYDRVAAIQALFRDPANGFTYDEQASTPGLNAPDALENFLLGRVGYCEQYASAMGAMVRGLGIPARVAVGFTPGTRLAGDTWAVTTNDAHAWPEVWFEGTGWVRFEPTPRRGQVTTPGYTSAPEVEVPAPGPSQAPTAAPALPGADPLSPGAVEGGADGAPGGTTDADGPAWLSPWLLLVPGLLLLLGAAAMVDAVRRRRRWRRPGPLTAWASMTDSGLDVGHRWRPMDSPRAAAAHLLRARPLPTEAADAVLRLGAAAERSRYARPDVVGAPSNDDGLRRDAETVRSALLATLGRGARWRARFAPPSTLLWARWALLTASDQGFDRVGSAAGGLGGRLRHPRRAG